VEVFANAKLNLTLDVLGKRDDGYHELCMVMQSIDLRDRLNIRRTENDCITVNTNLCFLPSDGRNLAAKAAKAFFDYTGQSMGLDIEIKKRIPVCAGMAGGSTDAAAVIRALNQLTEANLPLEELAKIGERVGSDVPYCVIGGTVLATGRGEILDPLPPLPTCYAVVSKPVFSISTPELFSRIDGCKVVCRPDTEGMLDALRRGNLGDVARRMYNVFEDVLPERQRRCICEIKTTLIGEGALGACMSGTGPTVFGLFEREEDATLAFQRLKEQYRDTFLCKTV